MADINKIKLPSGSEYNLKDYRIPGVDTTPTSGSNNFVTSDGVYNSIKDFESFYFVQGSSSAAGNAASGSYLSTKWEGTVPGVSTATNGLKIAYRIATNTGVSTAGVVLSIDGTNYYPVVIQKNTLVTTHYPVGTTVLMVFNSTQTATAYLTSNTKSTVTGCWQIMEYDSNTNTQQRVYLSSDNVEYPITTRYATTSGSSYYAEYGRYSEGVTLNPSTNTITASAFKVDEGTSSQILKADGSLGNIDSTPTQNSTNLVSSGGVYDTINEVEEVTATALNNLNDRIDSVQSDLDDISSAGTLTTTSTTALSTATDEALSGSISLHKIAKTGTYSDLIGTPTIPSAPGTLNTTATTAQSTNANEALSGNVTLHKVSKTGNYDDLLNKPVVTFDNSDSSAYYAHNLDSWSRLIANPTSIYAIGTGDMSVNQMWFTTSFYVDIIDSSYVISAYYNYGNYYESSSFRITNEGRYIDVEESTSANLLKGVNFNNVDATVTDGVAYITASTPGILRTANSTAQATSIGEALSGNITLHKVSKTGTYSDLIGTPFNAGSSGNASVVHNHGNSAHPSTATGDYSLAFGTDSNATNTDAIALGSSSNASGNTSFAAIGGSASGTSSIAIGTGTYSQNYGEVAIGRYNSSNKASDTIGDAGNTAFSVGIGVYGGRRNAVQVMQNGDMYIKGIGSYNGTNTSASSTLQTVIGNIPSAPGTLDTTATTAQSTSSNEALSGSITLHKIAKTGAYSDLIGAPTIPTKVSDLTNDSGFTSNTGTLTGVSFNGTAATVSNGIASITSIPVIVLTWNVNNTLTFPSNVNPSSIPNNVPIIVTGDGFVNALQTVESEIDANYGLVTFTEYEPENTEEEYGQFFQISGMVNWGNESISFSAGFETSFGGSTFSKTDFFGHELFSKGNIATSFYGGTGITNNMVPSAVLVWNTFQALPQILSGTSDPTSAQGNDGDIYIKLSS